MDQKVAWVLNGRELTGQGDEIKWFIWHKLGEPGYVSLS